jgi:hypothetical protein
VASDSNWTSSGSGDLSVAVPSLLTVAVVSRHQLPQQITRHGSFLADLVVQGKRVQRYPAQPSHKVSDERDIGVSRRHETSP